MFVRMFKKRLSDLLFWHVQYDVFRIAGKNQSGDSTPFKRVM